MHSCTWRSESGSKIYVYRHLTNFNLTSTFLSSKWTIFYHARNSVLKLHKIRHHFCILPIYVPLEASVTITLCPKQFCFLTYPCQQTKVLKPKQNKTNFLQFSQSHLKPRQTDSYTYHHLPTIPTTVNPFPRSEPPCTTATLRKSLEITANPPKSPATIQPRGLPIELPYLHS